MTYRDMSEMTRIQYLRSEIVVSNTIYEAATQILSSFIMSKQISDKNQAEVMAKSVKLALELAVTTDKHMSASDAPVKF
ncbi:MAG: hypothetical protein HY356_01640 [Gammaproteobacteria bacterium]|nr:hypothetical protein [Gammaproteobacteria bacterium]